MNYLSLSAHMIVNSGQSLVSTNQYKVFVMLKRTYYEERWRLQLYRYVFFLYAAIRAAAEDGNEWNIRRM